VSDKLQHAGAYFVLAFLVARAPRHAPGLKAVAVMLLSIAAFGAIDEWHQRFIPGRVPYPLDWVADMAGTIGALAITAIARNAFRNDDSRVQVT
jgi:VanZ family protein